MKLLLDTHAFLWLTLGDDRLPQSARMIIDASDDIVLSTASVWEAEIKRAAGRLRVPPVEASAHAAGIPVIPVTATEATHAAGLPRHHRDPFDRMLVAQAQLSSRVLITRDADLRSYAVAVAW
ncbi:MAG: type II toxin-antitoxin system VapC family toxin [Solirubrobacterales bacterium]|nr:type II toxin-antitoxin system VapC family toxin [Solirubrobacterales bacterium]